MTLARIVGENCQLLFRTEAIAFMAKPYK